MKLSNNELGELYTFRIFTKLCDSWPCPVKELSCQDITEVQLEGYDPNEWGFSDQQRPKEWDICLDLINWLETEGFIRTSDTSHDHHLKLNVEITQPALSSFRGLPDPLDPCSGNSLYDLLKSGAKTVSNSAISTITTSILSAITTQLF